MNEKKIKIIVPAELIISSISKDANPIPRPENAYMLTVEELADRIIYGRANYSPHWRIYAKLEMVPGNYCDIRLVKGNVIKTVLELLKTGPGDPKINVWVEGGKIIIG